MHEKDSVNSPLLVNESQVVNSLSICDSIRLARDAYVSHANNEALSPERVVLSVPGGVSVFAMPGHILKRKTLSVKIARLNPNNPGRLLPSVMAKIYVYDSLTGRELAHVEADALTALRTAASSAVATDLLASKNCETLGIIGSGRQARAHVSAMLLVRKFLRILVYSRNKTRRESFAASYGKIPGVQVNPASSADEVVKSSNVLVLATNSPVPLFKGNLVQPGTHVNAIGAALHDTRETDSFLVSHSRLVVDSIPQALSTYGDIMIPMAEGVISKSDLEELGDLLVHQARVATNPRQITLFKSGGLSVLDAAFADHIVARLLSPTA